MEHINCPGHDTSLLGLASHSSTYYKGCGLTQGWFPAANNTGFYTRQGYLIRNPDPKCSFQCAIPMRHIFGFVDDYSKVTYGMRDTLQLIRKDDNDALFLKHGDGISDGTGLLMGINIRFGVVIVII